MTLGYEWRLLKSSGPTFSKILKSNLGYKNFLGRRRNSQKFLAQSKDMKNMSAALATLEILRKILGIFENVAPGFNYIKLE